jgi:shikimate dehydrogenase
VGADRGLHQESLRPPQPDRGPLIRRFALLGEPVGHSVSPLLYTTAFEALGIDAHYQALETPASELPRLMSRLARDGGGGNVTVPHKQLAALQLQSPTEAVSRSGACNCFWGVPEVGLAGDNTDVAAFAQAAGTVPGFRLEGSRVLVLGAGGGARAVLLACVENDAAMVDIADRLPFRILRDAPQGPYDLVVNATSLGLQPADPLPLALERVPTPAVFDLVYGSEGTRWTRHARALDRFAVDGFEMLVLQAALSIHCWLGLDAPVEEMRRVGRAAILRSER